MGRFPVKLLEAAHSAKFWASWFLISFDVGLSTKREDVYAVPQCST